MEQIVYFDADDPTFLEDELGLNVTEVFDFGEDGAAVIETERSMYDVYSLDTRIFDIDANIEFQTHDIDAMDDGRLATIEDVKDLHDAHDGLDGEGQTVAIMDSGIDTTHPLFDGVDVEKVNMTDSTEVDTVGHGTAVAGQVIQLAPNARLVMLRVFGDRGRTSLRIILRAYEYVINNSDRINVLNMSLGTTQTSRRLNSIHNRVERNGVRTVVSAGNSGGPSGSPATAERAYSVGASDEEGRMASFSSYNPSGPRNPEVTAIGKNNKLAKSRNASMGQVLDEDYVKASGTSFSSPEVAGLVASLLSKDVEKPRDSLSNAARDIESTPRDGFGLVDYADALENGEKGEEPTTRSASVWQFAGGDVAYVSGDALESGQYTVEITEDGDGNTVFEFQQK